MADDVLSIAYEAPFISDGASLVVVRHTSDKREILTVRLEDQAEDLYRILTDQSCKFKIIEE